jgi:hypothetical protein
MTDPDLDRALAWAERGMNGRYRLLDEWSQHPVDSGVCRMLSRSRSHESLPKT